MKYKIVLFDLDGTLIESGPGIFAATRAMMKRLNIPDIPDSDWPKLVGPPLAMGFTEVLHVPKERLQEAIDLYGELAKTEGMELVKPYAGVPELLKNLRQDGRYIGVVTSKVVTTARVHLEKYGLLPDVNYVCGATERGKGEKTELLKRACTELELVSGAAVVMVGDRFYDLNAANNVGMASIGVTYGYGSEDEIRSCKPTHIVHSVAELEELLLDK